MIKKYEANQIKDNNCFKNGYKFDTIDLYWTTKEKFNTLDLNNLNLKDLTILLENMKTYGGNLDNSVLLIKETIQYSIAKDSNNNIITYKSKQISEYNNGQKNKIEIFENPNNNKSTPIIEPIKKGFWGSISCFFKTIFGGNY